MKKPIGILGLSLVLLVIILGLKAQAQVYEYNFTLFEVPFPGASNTLPMGINDLGDIVGIYSDSSGGRGFVRTGGVFSSVDVLGAIATQPQGINNSGDIVGYYYDTSWRLHGFLKAGNTYTTIDFPGAYHTFLHGINDMGIIVGEYWDGTTHGFVKIGDSFEAIEFPGAGPLGTAAYGINNLGYIVGVYFDESNKVHGFLKLGDIFTTVDVAGASQTIAHDINDFGHIVGSYDGYGFLKVGDEFITINQDLPGIYGTAPFGTNNLDQIVGGCGMFNEHGFLATLTNQPPVALCENLITLVNSFYLPKGITNTLVSELSQIAKLLTAGKTIPACNIVNEFIADTSAQSGKKITTDEANQMISNARTIKSAAGCP